MSAAQPHHRLDHVDIDLQHADALSLPDAVCRIHENYTKYVEEPRTVTAVYPWFSRHVLTDGLRNGT
jgi:hypothetical protein